MFIAITLLAVAMFCICLASCQVAGRADDWEERWYDERNSNEDVGRNDSSGEEW